MTGDWGVRLIAVAAAATLAAGVAGAGVAGPSIDGLSPATVIARIPGAIARQHTLQEQISVLVTQPVDEGGPERLGEELDVDFAHHSYARVTTDAGRRTEERFVGGHVYLLNTQPVAGLPPFWLDETAAVAAAGVKEGFPGSSTTRLLSQATDPRDEGVAMIDGRRTRHLRFTLSAAAILEELEGGTATTDSYDSSGLDGVTTSDVHLDLYVGPDNLPVREIDSLTVTDPSEPGQAATLTSTIEDHFGVDIQVVAPPAKEVHRPRD